MITNAKCYFNGEYYANWRVCTRRRNAGKKTGFHSYFTTDFVAHFACVLRFLSRLTERQWNSSRKSTKFCENHVDKLYLTTGWPTINFSNHRHVVLRVLSLLPFTRGDFPDSNLKFLRETTTEIPRRGGGGNPRVPRKKNVKIRMNYYFAKFASIHQRWRNFSKAGNIWQNVDFKIVLKRSKYSSLFN